MTFDSPLAAYQHAIDQQGFVPDDAQRRAVQALQSCFEGLHRPALGVVGYETLLGDGVLVGGERRAESHACQYDLHRDIQP